MTQTSMAFASDHPVPVAERAVLNRLLDLMIPASRDGLMPGAGALDLFADRGRLDDAAIAALREGLRGLDDLARQRHGAAFTELDEALAMPLVDEYRVNTEGFFGLFVMQSAARYYQHDRVMVALGLEPRSPWPQGHEVRDGDWSLLDPVRDRAQAHGNLYREL